MVDGWYTLPASTRFLFKQCFNHVFQEPYLMVRRSAFLPLFDDRFINYGYNKVQWVETLRWLGFQFALVTQSFAVDVPAPAVGVRAVVDEAVGEEGQREHHDAARVPEVPDGSCAT